MARPGRPLGPSLARYQNRNCTFGEFSQRGKLACKESLSVHTRWTPREHVALTMTSSLQQQQHAAKFRWTERLTWRFIQLRREHAKMFTGRKYSAQQGWEYILSQMRQESPAVMGDVHYRVLKKKWSNLLQQYKELRNPVHGDKNRADDISWPFYRAIDEVIASLSPSANNSRRRGAASCINDNYRRNPQEFLCVSVSPDDVATTIDCERLEARSDEDLEVDGQPRDSLLLSRLPRATQLTIGRPAAPVKRKNSPERSRAGVEPENGGATARKSRRREDGLERRIVEFMEYTKRRDEENRSIS
ncbi:uncharacterized protein LOC131671131 [Phymastichus coffea]|uniref:uncharacterized protein LOC131671131 n=1 Tax=Phymastichus coffea TaxID=108790 RepID=UPI00273C6BD0|nr:uncharacterized protein LOC131671131 [Phymastichus coffea]